MSDSKPFYHCKQTFIWYLFFQLFNFTRIYSLLETGHFFVFLTSWALKLYMLFFFKRCFTGYTGERCEHLTLTSYAVDSYEKYIAIGIGVGLLISGFLAVFYCYVRKRYEKNPKYEVLHRCKYLLSPYNVPDINVCFFKNEKWL